MSLLLYRREIARAVAGHLSVSAEEALRTHLRGCVRCRTHYDRLSLVAQGISAAATVSRAAAAPGSPAPGERSWERRAHERLLAALQTESPVGRTTPAPRERRDHLRRWWPAALLIVPAAAALLLVSKPVQRDVPGDVTWRGENTPSAPTAATIPGATPDRATPAALLVYASRKGAGGRPGPVRLVADLPASGEGHVSLSDYAQFSVRGLRTSTFVTVIGIDDRGILHIYAPRPGTTAAPARPADERPVALGPSVDLQRGHREGRLRLYALFSPQPIDDAHLRAAAARVDPTHPGVPPLDLPLQQVSGLLMVSP